MSQPGADGWILPLIPFHFTLVNDIKRDPFEQAVGIYQKTAASMQGALGAPVTAFIYDWNLLPIGQQLWLDWFETLQGVPANAGAGELQPHADNGSDEGQRAPERLVSRSELDVTGQACPAGAPARLWFPNRFVPRPLWVISRHHLTSASCPLCPR